MRRLAARVLDQRHTLGLWRLARVAPAWLVRREFIVVVRDLSAPLPPLVPVASLVRRSIAADPAQVARVDSTLTLRDIRRRLDEGQHGFVWWLDGEPAHVRWLATGPLLLPELGLTVRPCPGDVFIVVARTRADLRRRGLEILAGIDYLHAARAAGYRRVTGLVAWGNRVPLRAAHHLGYRVVGRVGAWNALLRHPPFATGQVHVDGARVLSILHEPESTDRSRA